MIPKLLNPVLVFGMSLEPLICVVEIELYLGATWEQPADGGVPASLDTSQERGFEQSQEQEVQIVVISSGTHFHSLFRMVPSWRSNGAVGPSVAEAASEERNSLMSKNSRSRNTTSIASGTLYTFKGCYGLFFIDSI